MSSTLLLDLAARLPVMQESITQVFARNLLEEMERQGLNQPAMAQKSGVSQKTISNCLNPTQRPAGSKGRDPSPKLSNVEKLAKALGLDAWKLLLPMERGQRQAFDAIEKAVMGLAQTPKHDAPAYNNGTGKKAA